MPQQQQQQEQPQQAAAQRSRSKEKSENRKATNKGEGKGKRATLAVSSLTLTQPHPAPAAAPSMSCFLPGRQRGKGTGLGERDSDSGTECGAACLFVFRVRFLPYFQCARFSHSRTHTQTHTRNARPFRYLAPSFSLPLTLLPNFSLSSPFSTPTFISPIGPKRQRMIPIGILIFDSYCILQADGLLQYSVAKAEREY